MELKYQTVLTSYKHYQCEILLNSSKRGVKRCLLLTVKQYRKWMDVASLKYLFYWYYTVKLVFPFTNLKLPASNKFKNTNGDVFHLRLQ